MTESTIPLSQVIIHGAIAFLGALTHAARSQKNGESKTFVDFLTLTLMSSFSGAMFALAGFHFFADEPYLTMMLAGTGGFLGVEGMVIIIDKVQQVITKK